MVMDLVTNGISDAFSLSDVDSINSFYSSQVVSWTPSLCITHAEQNILKSVQQIGQQRPAHHLLFQSKSRVAGARISPRVSPLVYTSPARLRWNSAGPGSALSYSKRYQNQKKEIFRYHYLCGGERIANGKSNSFVYAAVGKQHLPRMNHWQNPSPLSFNPYIYHSVNTGTNQGWIPVDPNWYKLKSQLKQEEDEVPPKPPSPAEIEMKDLEPVKSIDSTRSFNETQPQMATKYAVQDDLFMRLDKLYKKSRTKSTNIL